MIVKKPPKKLLADTISINDFEKRGYLVIKCGESLIYKFSRMLNLGSKFFSLPVDEKQRNFSTELFEGYRNIGIEYSKVLNRPDLSESFSVRLINHDKTDSFLGESAKFLYEIMIDITNDLNIVLDSFIPLLAAHFEDNSTPVTTFRCDKGSHLQLNYYQPNKHDRDFLQDEHEDALLVTFTFGTAPGLELALEHDKYEPFALDFGELLIMPGEIISLLTGNRIKPLFHRVRNHTELSERFSMMYFVNPNPTSKLTPWVSNDYNYGVDILERAITNPMRFGLPSLPTVQ